MNLKILNCKICKCRTLIKKFEYFKKPTQETKYQSVDYNNYYRAYYKCSKCNHFSSNLNDKITKIYTSEYNKSVYLNDIKKNFLRINNLPEKKSDNYFRVKRIKKFIDKEFNNKKKKIEFLDIGSGLGVFPFKMKSKNINITALDPDKKSCDHLKKNLKLNTICADFLKLNIKKKYNFISLNKVIEHVMNPRDLLIKAKKSLLKGGYIYLEVPDIKAAIKGKNREEFFIEHYHVFSIKSLRYISKFIKMKLKIIKSINEPSGKFTLYALLQRK